MLFNSVSFLIYFPIVVLINFVLPKKARNIWLLVASYYFYMCWNAKYGLLIALSTLITYGSSLIIDGTGKKWLRKTAFFLCLASNLGILFFFKYFQWILDNINQLFHQSYSLPFSILLPVGISFYTFQALGYTIDVYRGDLKAERSLINYALFVSFFPQLVAGPIERSTNLLKQFRVHENFNPENAVRGLQIMIWGFFEKMVIADNLAILVDHVYADWANYSGSILLLSTALFAIQIYCDFGGYSHIAIGAAKVLNVDLMTNFRQPFFASSIKEHWRRWHISLSTWFKDYVYIPMGGNRCSRVRHNFNIFVTFFISGLWHGASWHYVIWGALHGVYQIVGSYVEPVQKRLCKVVHIDFNGIFYKTMQRIVTFLLIVITFIFFRAVDVPQALEILKKTFLEFGAGSLINGEMLNLGLNGAQMLTVGIAMVMLLIVDILHERNISISTWINQRNVIVRWGVYYAMILYILMVVLQTFGKSASSFLYFQF